MLNLHRTSEAYFAETALWCTEKGALDSIVDIHPFLATGTFRLLDEPKKFRAFCKMRSKNITICIKCCIFQNTKRFLTFYKK
jgi:hypothetical protein